jgi:shikimate kinase
MSKPQNVFLIGPMGAGKTTIGHYLATTLGFTFYDSDHEIETRAGATVSWIFDVEGEAGFRKREEQVIDDLTHLNDIVLATGGGVVLSPRNRAVLAARGVVIYLRVSIENQLLRLQHSHDRPLLKTSNPAEVLTRLQAQREPLYQELADYILDTNELNARAVAQAILAQVQPVFKENE